jgi:hypothetical protein
MNHDPLFDLISRDLFGNELTRFYPFVFINQGITEIKYGQFCSFAVHLSESLFVLMVVFSTNAQGNLHFAHVYRELVTAHWFIESSSHVQFGLCMHSPLF